MKTNKTREELIKMYIDTLSEGEIPWRKRWINDSNINGITKIEYKGINQLMLNFITYKEKYNDNRWFTYKQIENLGLKLNNAKGKGVPIEFWSAYNIKTKKKFNFKEYSDYIEKNPEEKENFRVIVKNAVVFNGALIEGLPEIKIKDKNIKPSSYIQKILRELEVSYEEKGNQAYYNILEDKITLPKKEMFIDEYSYYATQLHEICHSTGHQKRLNRNMENNKLDYAREELIAEISSSFLMQDLKIPSETEHYDNHKAYIQNWISILSDKPNELFKAISEANNITKFLDNKIINKNQTKNRGEQNEKTI